MTANVKLRAEADRRRAAFFQSAKSTADQVRPVVLLDNVVGALDPGFALLNRFQSAAKQNPLAMLAAVGGLWLLIRQLKSSELQTKSATRRVMRSYRLPRATPKGDENGYINDAEQH